MPTPGLRPVVLAGLAAMVFAAGPCAAAAPSAPPSAKAPAKPAWPMREDGADVVIETPHYVLRTDLGPDAAQVLASHQEALYAELYRRMGDLRPRMAVVRQNVLAVRSEQRYLAEVGSDGAGTGGVYIKSQNRLACWGPPYAVLEALRHEGTHQFVDTFIGSGCPIWLNEGLAEFYEGGVFDEGRLDVGQPLPGNVMAIRSALAAGRLIPLRTMLMMDHDQWAAPLRSGSTEAPLQYAQAWAMVHFLAYGEGGKYRIPFQKYIALVARGRQSDWAWENVFGKGYDAFEARWRGHVSAMAAEVECLIHLQVLGAMLCHERARPALFSDIETFRRSAVEGKFGVWGPLFAYAAGALTSREQGQAGLFRCPLDKRPGDAPSYEMAPAAGGDPPVLRCRCHPGVVLETAYEKDDSGLLSARVAERPAKSLK